MTSNQRSPAQRFDLTGKTALVTGAGKGIGRACAQALSEAGATVIAAARTAADLQSLAELCPGEVISWCVDVADPDTLEQIAALESLDILVNNVGTNKPQAFLEVEAEALDNMLSLNLRSAFLVAQACARIMARKGSGSIIHMGSQMGHVGARNRSVYCMTKHGIEGLTKAMAIDLAPHGIRVNAVAPTFVETPLTQPMLKDPEFMASVLEKIPMGRVAQADEIASAVLFLASDAASMVNGDSLKVDGGWTAQ